MNIYCLVIDDDKNQITSFETDVTRVLRKDGIEVEMFFVHTKDYKYIDEKTETLKYEEILKDCISILDSRHISVIACDYGIATRNDDFTGVNLLADIANTYPGIYKILYSGTIHKVVKDITGRDDEHITSHLLNLTKIHDFNRGKGYSQKIIDYLRNPEIKFKQKILDQLKNKYPELTFKSCYPDLAGITLKEVAEEMEKETYKGRRFQEILLEQVIAYLIAINDEE